MGHGAGLRTKLEDASGIINRSHRNSTGAREQLCRWVRLPNISAKNWLKGVLPDLLLTRASLEAIDGSSHSLSKTTRCPRGTGEAGGNKEAASRQGCVRTVVAMQSRPPDVRVVFDQTLFVLRKNSTILMGSDTHGRPRVE